MDLNQVGASVTGTWAATGGTVRPVGNISGTVDTASFTGTVTFNYSGGPTCSGSFTGSAGGATLTWNSPGLTTGSCGLNLGNPLTVRWVMQRR